MTEHYGGKDNPHEARKCLSAWGLTGNAYMWTVGKYLSRLGKKPGNSELADLKKMKDYIDYRIEELEVSEKLKARDEYLEKASKETVREHDGVNTVNFRGIPKNPSPVPMPKVKPPRVDCYPHNLDNRTMACTKCGKTYP